MAFEIDSLVCYRTGASLKVAGTRSVRFWSYATADDWAAINVAGYWNNARVHVGIGDIIDIHGDMDGTPFHRRLMFATVPASGNVTVVQIANS